MSFQNVIAIKFKYIIEPQSKKERLTPQLIEELGYTANTVMIDKDRHTLYVTGNEHVTQYKLEQLQEKLSCQWHIEDVSFTKINTSSTYPSAKIAAKQT